MKIELRNDQVEVIYKQEELEASFIIKIDYKVLAEVTQALPASANNVDLKLKLREIIAKNIIEIKELYLPDGKLVKPDQFLMLPFEIIDHVVNGFSDEAGRLLGFNEKKPDANE